jgi:hypothetical protein
MGENANASWAWHNTVVGEGYQAKGVVRQPGMKAPSVQVVDSTRQQGVTAQQQQQQQQHSNEGEHIISKTRITYINCGCMYEFHLVC